MEIAESIINGIHYYTEIKKENLCGFFLPNDTISYYLGYDNLKNNVIIGIDPKDNQIQNIYYYIALPDSFNENIEIVAHQYVCLNVNDLASFCEKYPCSIFDFIKFISNIIYTSTLEKITSQINAYIQTNSKSSKEITDIINKECIEYVSQKELWTAFYLNFNDDNKRHCDNAFDNNHYFHSCDVLQANKEWTFEIFNNHNKNKDSLATYKDFIKQYEPQYPDVFIEINKKIAELENLEIDLD